MLLRAASLLSSSVGVGPPLLCTRNQPISLLACNLGYCRIADVFHGKVVEDNAACSLLSKGSVADCGSLVLWEFHPPVLMVTLITEKLKSHSLEDPDHLAITYTTSPGCKNRPWK
ncbi:PREDICTED: uncharacterized protein LOC106806323 [Priapulus caudatus]|uniref:Uncharacterized protein LOC106806323 n=1 Tax=Priapulus caudatus TaxID=37621 RepID=A0ABM1DUT4_PRICU|nr:PREDICTED: uncharacterized protein LOC106806323 [Priapulus caudatus]